jgi:hypothetical protein
MIKESDQVIEVFNAKIVKLEEELALHRESRCECHQEKTCTCDEEYTPLGVSQLWAEGWHCLSHFLLDCELSELQFPSQFGRS